MVATITLYQKDKGMNIDFVVKDDNGDVVDLTGASATFKVGVPGEGLLISGTCTIVDEAAGSVRYTVSATDLLTPGRYKGELKVTFSASKLVTVNEMDVNIRNSL